MEKITIIMLRGYENTTNLENVLFFSLKEKTNKNFKNLQDTFKYPTNAL